jgi:hypothetical protein
VPFFGAREKELLEREVGRAPESEREVGLFTALPTKAETNTELKTKELKFTGYARVKVAGGATWWKAATGESPAVIVNEKAIVFGEWTAGADEKATHFVIFSGTAPVAFGALEATVTIGAGNKVASFAAGALEATVT